MGAALITNAKQFGRLRHPCTEARLRRIAESSLAFKKFFLKSEQYEANLHDQIERLRNTLRDEALNWQIRDDQLLLRVETRFEAQYRYWKAEALKRIQQNVDKHAEQGGFASLLGAAKEAASALPSVQHIEAVLMAGERLHAAELWQAIRKHSGKPGTKTALYDEAGQDKAEYYRWERGELPNGSQADKDIRRVLLNP